MKRAALFLKIFLIIVTTNTFALTRGINLPMRSPSGNISAELFPKDGRLFYSIKADGKPVIDQSEMGIVVDGVAYGSKITSLNGLKKGTIYSKSGDKRKGYNFYSFSVFEASRSYTIEFRLSNEGAAFRYIFTGTADQRVMKELTCFRFPESRVWFFERKNSWKLKSYAGLWIQTPIDSLPIISNQGPVQGKPLLFELPGKKYAMLTEAALYNYSGMRFKALGNRTLQTDFTETGGFSVSGDITTPWRVLLYASNLNDLVNNTMINDLNPEPDPHLYADTKYIKPGRSVWSWITRTANYMEPREEMKFITAASELNFEYTLLDEGWETKWADKWTQLRDICTFAGTKKVGVWVWKNSKGLRDSSTRERFLDSVKNTGAVGIKTDFMDSEAKELVDFEIGFLKACAKRKLMVNFHGCHPPTGESKTYPNEMTREGIRGMELNIMNEPIPAWHNAALPFTRLVLGHGDYTPGLFYNKANTTNTHQLALFYLFNSPFQCLAENPIKLLADDKFKPIIPLLKTLPVTWDETIVLPGSSIAEVAAFAKRKGDKWYVVAINGTTEKKEINLKPYFLTKSKKYKETIITDARVGDGFLKTESTISRIDFKKIVIGPNAGVVIEIKPFK
ncbi:glycoside hydrolase family 97 protein [Pedobacter hiemivivus]|uniref:Glycoside hydrolase family 97 protein n=1 Tax=Pedobacter hiemivivus TaxID=2530454 RepID=A0A4R0N7N6_9SPHI|nr:glycoside hydrolase family 97 protein [Pedobacter hiemivivus]TCC96070.1 hypothetical protein EZ444_13590 [Pedobacter hiemivivus]